MLGKILVTGGLGQVGSYLCEELLSRGYGVTILDNLSARVNPCPAGADLVKGDVRDAELVISLVGGSDAVIHCAAQVHVSRSMEDPAFDAGVNITGTLNLLEAARRADVKRFIYFSSAAVYGNPLKLPINELHPQNPVSAYGVSKLAGEKYTLMFHKAYGLPTTAIRPFNIYSPRQDPSSPYSGVISKFLENVSKGYPPTIYGNGSATRDFVSAHDVVHMALLMLESGAAIGKAFNCGTGNRTRIDELAATIVRLYRKGKLAPKLWPERPGDIRHNYADISLAKRLLGFNPRVELDEGLREVIASKKKSSMPKPRYSPHLLKLRSVDIP
jgi:UDP-glucose 4-epimerase